MPGRPVLGNEHFLIISDLAVQVLRSKFHCFARHSFISILTQITLLILTFFYSIAYSKANYPKKNGELLFQDRLRGLLCNSLLKKHPYTGSLSYTGRYFHKLLVICNTIQVQAVIQILKKEGNSMSSLALLKFIRYLKTHNMCPTTLYYIPLFSSRPRGPMSTACTLHGVWEIASINLFSSFQRRLLPHLRAELRSGPTHSYNSISLAFQI